MTITITCASGASRQLPHHLEDSLDLVCGLDSDGRIVVDTFGARYAPPDGDRSLLGNTPFIYGLTLCCDAYDKGMEDGVYCRKCYGEKSLDTGNYIYRAANRTFPGLDPTVSVLTVTT